MTIKNKFNPLILALARTTLLSACILGSSQSFASEAIDALLAPPSGTTAILGTPPSTSSTTNIAAPTGNNPKPLGKLQDLTDRASELVMQAMGTLGISYRRGGEAPENGFDCSGLVRHVFREAWGSTLPRTAAELSRVGKKIMPQDLQPGDLVFYNTLRRGFSHVGIYLGDNKFIHSPSSGGQVRIESMEVGYWKKRFNGARRVEDPIKDAAINTAQAPTLATKQAALAASK